MNLQLLSALVDPRFGVALCVSAAAFVLLSPSLGASNQDKPKQKTSGAEVKTDEASKKKVPYSPAQVSAFLPAILEKAIQQQEIVHRNSTEYFLKLFEIWEAGFTSPPRSRTLDELLRIRIRILKREEAYQNLTEKAGKRHGMQEAAVEGIAERTLEPLLDYIGKIQQEFVAHAEFASRFSKLDGLSSKELRLAIRKIMEEPLLNGRESSPRLAEKWTDLAKRSEAELSKLRREYQRQAAEILDEQAELSITEKSLSDAKKTRLRELDFARELLNFETLLRRWEQTKTEERARGRGENWSAINSLAT